MSSNHSLKNGVNKELLYAPENEQLKANTDECEHPYRDEISIRYIRRIFRNKTKQQISSATIEYIQQQVEHYVDVLIASIVEEHNRQNEIRRKAGLDIRRTIHGENLYLKMSAEPINNVKLVSQFGEVGEDNIDTTLSTNGGVVK